MMDCTSFRDRVHALADESSCAEDWTERDVQEMGEHRNVCGACREFERDMARLLDGLDTLRNETRWDEFGSQSSSGPAIGEATRDFGHRLGHQHGRRWRAGLAVAAVIAAIALGRSLLTSDPSRSEHHKREIASSVPQGSPGQPAVILTGQSARDFIPVAARQESPKVHIVWLYRVATPAKPDGAKDPSRPASMVPGRASRRLAALGDALSRISPAASG